jgi:hypothetical protein
MRRIYLIHWKPQECADKIRDLEAAGYTVVTDLPMGPNFARHVEETASEVVVIDLSRLPSQGRDLAVMLRTRKGTRSIPILFVDGETPKVAAIQQLLPDATYTTWETLPAEITKLLELPPKEYSGLDSVFAAYSNKSLAEKLGIKPGIQVCLAFAPEELEDELLPLPASACLTRVVDRSSQLYLWFFESSESLNLSLSQIVEQVKHAPCWIAWPKNAQKNPATLNQATVRRIAMDAGMVDYKICSINAQWSALLFSWRG